MKDSSMISTLIVRTKDGKHSDVRIGIGLPYIDESGVWRCHVEMPGIANGAKIAGDDGLQAICLAIRFLRTNLLHLQSVENMSFFHKSDDGELYPVDFSSYFDDTATDSAF